MDYILGMAKSDGSVKILLDIDKILDTADMSQLAQAA
jgi:chemotaxis signal transduction protein